MTEPTVEVIIPVHTPRRPIARAVGSVLEGTVADVRVNVVCHNTDPANISEALGPWAADDRVRLLHHEDGFASPAGPINHGYGMATGLFTCLLDSDDEYERGAVDAWLEVQARDAADVVIAPLRHADGRSPRTPPTRPGRTRALDGVRDRLAYRTRQHGLVRRERFPTLAMTPRLRTGEDVVQGIALWYSGARISLAQRAPAYIIHTDHDDRTSASPKSAAESLLFLDTVLDSTHVGLLTKAQRESLAVKLLRTHLMEILAASLAAGAYTADQDALAAAVDRITRVAPSSMWILSRREARIARGVRDHATGEHLSAELDVLTDYRRPSNLVPASPRYVLHREAMPRFLAAVAFTR